MTKKFESTNDQETRFGRKTKAAFAVAFATVALAACSNNAGSEAPKSTPSVVAEAPAPVPSVSETPESIEPAASSFTPEQQEKIDRFGAPKELLEQIANPSEVSFKLDSEEMVKNPENIPFEFIKVMNHYYNSMDKSVKEIVNEGEFDPAGSNEKLIATGLAADSDFTLAEDLLITDWEINEDMRRFVSESKKWHAESINYSLKTTPELAGSKSDSLQPYISWETVIPESVEAKYRLGETIIDVSFKTEFDDNLPLNNAFKDGSSNPTGFNYDLIFILDQSVEARHPDAGENRITLASVQY